MTLPATLPACLLRLAQLQQQSVDRHAVVEAAGKISSISVEPSEVLRALAQQLHWKMPLRVRHADPAKTPLLGHHPQWGWLLIRGQDARRQWLIETWDATNLKFQEQSWPALDECFIAKVSLQTPFEASRSPVYQLVKREIASQKRALFEASIGGIVLNSVALGTSLYSMQVYDRVVPTGAFQTLWVLTLGVLLAILFEWAIKHVRSHLFSALIDAIDQRLARAVYMRFLAIRLDQMPKSVGGLASQLRGYESVRGFMTAVTTQMLIDAPFALLFLVLIGTMGHPMLALVPAIFLLISLFVGTYYRQKIEALALKSTSAANFKTGLLVESVEGAETIKSGQGGWRMLGKWLSVTDEARQNELEMRDITERNQHLTASFQQVSYVLMVATGALMVSRGELTMGALIACSILSGRVLTPFSMVPAQLVQWAQVKAALQSLDQIWRLQDDHEGIDHPIAPETLKGHFQIENVSTSYGGPQQALVIPQWTAQPGEKIGVIGPIGSGKTTLLRLLSGMYKPTQGRVLLDQIDMSHLSKPLLADHIGFLQQDGRLFAGTLRENLILGQIDPGDEAILAAAQKTGLLHTVVTPHPKGLLQDIAEGGTGLSAGQRQLVNLTRIYLRRPTVWLLDEPTSSMDRQTEMAVLTMLSECIQPHHTLVLVTHKPELLSLVQRLMVIAKHQVVMDGPKEQVVAQLQNKPTPQPSPQGVNP